MKYNEKEKQSSLIIQKPSQLQNNYQPTSPSYPIVKRAIYYGAREISSQLGILTDTTNYNDIEKVYSIWICNENIPDELQNTMSSYRITKTDEIGITDEIDSDYDLMNVVIIRRGKNTGDADIFKYLTAYFSSNIDEICNFVDIKDDEEIMEGVKKMSGLGQSIFQNGFEQGSENGQLKTLFSLVKKGIVQIAEAAEEMKISVEEFSKLLSEQNKQ